jgi:hypothetical protein
VNIKDIYLNVLDGKLYASDSLRDPAVVISNAKNMLAFVSQSQCQTFTDKCYVMCKSHCFSSIRFEIDPANTEKFVLKVCKRGNSVNCIFVAGATVLDDTLRTNNHRTFIAHLPSGTYDAVFLDEYMKTTWPIFVNQRDEHQQCQSSRFPKAIVHLKVPPLLLNDCSQLVRNSLMEITTDSKPKYWLSRFSSIELVPKKGIDRSTAIGDLDRSSTSTIGQFLDSRCIKAYEGEFYELTAFIKSLSLGGKLVPCNEKNNRCPDIGILTDTDVFHIVSSIESEVDRDGFQKANGFIKIDESIARSEQTFFSIRSNSDNKIIVVDNVSMRLISDPKSYCDNIILDSGMENMMKIYWDVSGSGSVGRTTSGYASSNGILNSNRKIASDGLSYKYFRSIEKECLVPNSKWSIVGQMKMIHKVTGRGDSCVCNMKTTCPQVQVGINDSNGNRVFVHWSRNYTLSYWKSSEFNRFTTSFTLPPLASCEDDKTSSSVNPNAATWDGSVGFVSIDVRNFPPECNLIIDDFVVTTARGGNNN